MFPSFAHTADVFTFASRWASNRVGFDPPVNAAIDLCRRALLSAVWPKEAPRSFHSLTLGTCVGWAEKRRRDIGLAVSVPRGVRIWRIWVAVGNIQMLLEEQIEFSLGSR